MTDPAIDLDVFSELKDATGDEFAAELVTTFLEEAEGMFEDLKSSAAGGDADGYRRAAHSIKSNANTFGAVELAALARNMELGDFPGDGADAAIDTLAGAFDRAATALKGLIDA